jgi:hypothetical protein
MEARAFTDEHDLGCCRPVTRYGFLAGVVQAAFGAGFGLFGNLS